MESGTMSTSGWVVLGGGVALMGVSAFFVAGYAERSAAVDDAAADWATAPADEAGAALRRYAHEQDEAMTDAGLAIATGIAGVAAVSTGIVLLVLASGDPDEARVVPTVGPGSVGVAGRF